MIIKFTVFKKYMCVSFKVISQVDNNMKSMVTKHMKLFFIKPQTQSQF